MQSNHLTGCTDMTFNNYSLCKKRYEVTGGHNLNISGVYLHGLEGEGAYRNFDLSSICFFTLIMTCPLTSH